MTVFVPLTLDDVRRLRATGSLADVVGYAPGPALRGWLEAGRAGDGRLEDEEVDYVALTHAGVAALTQDDGAPSRLVVAVEREALDGDALGAVRLDRLDWTDVRSLFADEAGAGSAVAAARAAVRGQTLGTALSDPAVEELQDAYDLLWYAPDELDSLLATT